MSRKGECVESHRFTTLGHSVTDRVRMKSERMTRTRSY